ncbi:alpha/beta hydrolase [Flocculibacter collagenilyticus]|uniref:alpha/beta hydrolase n=1 Tax=Flocculibacter collagenilyticus TaxID=2744479 RepID=UPI0018F6E3FF|nr:alpha/beta hydrolase [Flocculibacter collagenilyticus]
MLNLPICKITNLVKKIAAISSVLLITACNQSSSNNNVSNETHELTLGDRSYILSLPNNYSPTNQYKLLFAFHGSGGNGGEMQNMSRFEQLSSEYIVAYPNAKETEWNEGCNCNKPHRLGVDDLAFVDDLIDNISHEYSIKEGEIYAAGFSQGGLFIQNLLCNRSHKFKALASVGSPMSVQLSESCNIEQPTSYMMVHAKQDNVLPYQGLAHPNFGLISSPDAINLLAQKNGSLANPLEKNINQGTSLTAYWSGNVKTNLYSILHGDHRWQFSVFDTSNEILSFFESAEQPALPEHSELIKVGENTLHIRTMGDSSEKPTIVLLSGPNKNYHSDSAWFSLLQPILAEDYKVIAIDRPGNAWSTFNESTSYTHFTDVLHQTLTQLNENNVILVAFSSANITASLFEQKYGQDDAINLAGMLWIDPDIFLPHSIAMYQDFPVTYYREMLNDLLPYLAEGGWTERTQNKIIAERTEVESLLDEGSSALMDWSYFDAVSQQRILVDRQQTRALEIANYHDDLNLVANLPLITSIPVSVIDSDFEQQSIDDNPDYEEVLTQWMEEGTEWSKQVVNSAGGQYIPIESGHHLVPLQHPQLIKDAIDWLSSLELSNK